MTEVEASAGGWRADLAHAGGELRAFSRRGFFTLVGLVALGVATISALVLSLRFVTPSIVTPAPRLFPAGRPESFPVGSTTVFADQRVALNRDVDGFYAVSMVCAHMECTVRWFATEGMFRCPCHGARFLRDGDRFYGPAPGPLARWDVMLRGDGSILINLDKRVGEATRLAV
jgi:cytochrome b6-f complex iron-sulfur subunit